MADRFDELFGQSPDDRWNSIFGTPPEPKDEEEQRFREQFAGTRPVVESRDPGVEVLKDPEQARELGNIRRTAAAVDEGRRREAEAAELKRRQERFGGNTIGGAAVEAVGKGASDLAEGTEAGWDSALAMMRQGRVEHEIGMGRGTPELERQAAEEKARSQAEIEGAPEGALSWFGQAVGQIAGSLYSGMKQASEVAAIGGAVGAAATAPAGGAGVVPGAGAGFTAGFLADSYQVNAGFIGGELREAGVDPDIARPAMIVGGSVMAALDLVSFKVLSAPMRAGVRRLIQREFADTVMENADAPAMAAFKEYLKQGGTETGTETLQEVAQTVAVDVAKTADEQDFETIFNDPEKRKELLQRAWDTALVTATGMTVVGIPGAAVRGVQARGQRDAQIDQAVGEPFTDPRTASQAFSPGRDTITPQPRAAPEAQEQVEALERGAPLVTPADEASPLPTELIQEGKGKSEIDLETLGSDAVLQKLGFPRVGTEVVVRRGPDGVPETGKVVGAFNVDGRDGVRVQLNDGAVYEDLADNIQGSGASITPLDQYLAEPVAEPANETQPLITPSTAPLNESQPLTSAPLARDVVKAKIKQVESGGKANAKNPNSSASGLYQFIDSTWAALGADPNKRLDPAEQERLMDKLLDQNEAALARAGIEPTAGNLYLAHFLGAGGAVNALANPNAPVPAAVQKANPFAKGWTNAQLAAWADRKMGGAGVYAGTQADTGIDYDDIELKFSEAESADTEVDVPPREPEGESYTEKASAAPVAEDFSEDDRETSMVTVEKLNEIAADPTNLAGLRWMRGSIDQTREWFKTQEAQLGGERVQAARDAGAKLLDYADRLIATHPQTVEQSAQQRTEAAPTQWLTMPKSGEPRRFATRKSAELWAKNNKVDPVTIAQLEGPQGGFGFKVALEAAPVDNRAPDASGAATEGIPEAAPPSEPPPSLRISEREDEAVTGSGRAVPVRYAVVEADELIASNTADGKRNPAYPANLQPRDRSRGVSQTQVAEIASNLNPRLLGASPKASDGAPIISPAGIVESGNGRTLAIQSAYAQGGKRAKAYLDFIESEGFDTTGLKRPVLVRVRSGELSLEDVEAFTREANARDTLGFSATEQAMSDSAAMPEELLALYRGGDIDSANNREFVRGFLRRVVPSTDYATMVAKDGSISQTAIARVRSALLARAYGDANLVGQVAEASDSNIKALGGALTDVAGLWAKLVEAVKTGTVDPAMDITANINEAVRIVDQARREGRTVSELVGQLDIFSGKAIDEKTEQVLRLMFATPKFTRPTSRKAVADALSYYVEQAMLAAPGGGLLQDAPKATPGGILANAKGKQRGSSDVLETPAGSDGGSVRPAGETNAESRREGVQARAGEEAPQQEVATGDVLGPRETDTRDFLQRKADDRLIPAKEQKAPGEDGGLFDTPETTGDLFAAKPAAATTPVERAKAILRAGLDELGDRPTNAEQERAKADAASEGMVPLFDDENIERQIGWLDPKTGKVQRLEADEATVAEPPAPEYQGADAEGRTTDPTQRDAGAVPVRPGGRTRALGIAETLSTHGSAKLVGRRVSHPKELADLAQIYRDPRYETFRVFFIKGGKIIHATGVSARLPNEAPLLPADLPTDIDTWMREQMERTEADGYYLLHNHPSGDPQPSPQDANTTKRIASRTPGFLGHVVINSGKYAVINAEGGSKVRDLNVGEDKLLKPSRPHPLLGAPITHSEQLARIGKATQLAGYVTLLGTSGRNGELRVIVDYPVSELERSSLILMGALRRVQRMSGSSRLFLVGPQGSLDHKAVRDAYRHKLLTDVVDESGAFMSSKVGVDREPLPEPFTASTARFVAEDGGDYAAPRRHGLSKEAGRPLAAFTGTEAVESSLKAHPDYKAAKAGDEKAALRLVRDLVPRSMLEQARDKWGGAMFVPVTAEEASGSNQIPRALARLLASAAGGTVERNVIQSNRAYHTGAKAADRMIARPLFDGEVGAGQKYVVVDDVTVMGATLAELASHIQEGGGEVVGTALLVNAARNPLLGGDKLRTREVERRFGDVVRDELGIEPSALTTAEAQYLLGFRDADALRERIAKAKGERSRRLAARGIGPQASALDEPGGVAEEASAYQANLPTITESQPERLWGPIRHIIDSFADSQKVARSLDDFRTIMRDRMLPVLRAQAAAERMLGRKLEDAENPYLGEELFHGRTGARLDQLTESHVTPLFEQMQEEKVTPDELETFLYARHAKERNARISSINPEFQKGEGSGMTDAEADAIMAEVDKSGKREGLERLARRVDAMLDFALKTRVEAGLLSQAEADSWKETYRHYVPLRGRPGENEDVDAGIGRINRQSGMSVGGRESRRAFGRKSKAADILAYSILQAEEAVIRAEQNEVAKAFHALAKVAPDPGFWKIDKIRRVPVFDKASGQVVYRSESRISAEDAPYTVSAKINGTEHRITLNRDNPTAARVAAAMRNLNIQQFQFVVATFGKINRFLSAVNTSYNPEFVISNAFRDLQTAGVNLTGLNVKSITRKVLADYPSALKAATKGAFGKGSGEWGRWHREFRMEGGQTAFNDMRDVKDLQRQVAAAAKTASTRFGARRLLKGFMHAVEGVNSGVENAIRLATYKNAVEAGLSKKQAASLAKNITVNFNRKGSAGPLINSLYLFFNASLQGSVRIFQAMHSSKKVQGILLGAVAAGFALELLNSMWSDDDDDGEKFYDKIPEFEKQRNLIVMMDGGRYIKIPLPWGYNVFPNMGRMFARMYRGDKLLNAIGDWMVAVLESFNPVGGAGNILNLIAPTVADPIVDLTRNRNFADKPIMPDEKAFGPQEPDAQRYWGSVPVYWRAVTDFLTEATGGDEIRPGAIDVSPETLDYLSSVVLGAAGAFAQNSAGTLINSLSDDPDATVDKNRLPFVRKLVGNKPEWYDKSAFYARLAEIEQTVSYSKEYLKAGDIEGLDRLFADEGNLIAMENVAKAARKEMARHRKVIRELDYAVAKGEIGKDEAKDIRAAIEERQNRTIEDFNANYLSRVEQPTRP